MNSFKEIGSNALFSGLEFLNNLAQENQGKIISTEWQGTKEKYTCQFSDGREFTISYKTLKSNGWPKDPDKYFKMSQAVIKNNQDKLEELMVIAKKNNAILLSTEWKGSSHLYDFMLDNGVVFQRSAIKVKNRKWIVDVNNIYNQLKEDNQFLKQLETIAIENKRKLISTKCQGAHAKYLFEFEDGRQFDMTFHKMKEKGWPKDPNSYLKMREALNKTDQERLDELSMIATENKGKLISDKWVDNRHKYIFEFEDGRQFSMQVKNLKKNGWPKDPDNYLRDEVYFLEDMQLIAKKRKGLCLSTEWKGVDDKYNFIDQYNNEFQVSYSALKKGQWSPDRGLVVEPICRQIIEHLFSYQFPKSRKILTKERTGLARNLELDGYCEQLKVAFEYQGHPSHYDSSNKKYLEVSKKDKFKKIFCKENNIVLIEIPVYQSRKLDSKSMLEHVMNAVQEAYKNATLPELNKATFSIDFSKINHCQEKLDELKLIAMNNNGKLVSTEWKGNNAAYVFELEDKTTLNRTAKYVKKKGLSVRRNS